jgi:hypothetical protein
MPYIAPEDRPQYETALSELEALLKGKPPGHLTYLVYRLAKSYCPEQRYAAMSATRACINDASAEYFRRVMAPYEDKQVEKNGDV